MSKRLLAQIIFFFLQNPLLKNYFTGRIYQGRLKMLCTPGLNCYSCPAATFACPIGALQSFFAGARRSVSLYVAGFLLTSGTAFGRFICGYVCPMGLLQDLLYKIKSPKLKPLFLYARYLKYLILLLFVILLPLLVRHELSGLGEPWFCKYICPSGTIFAAGPLLMANGFLRDMAGALLALKISLALGFIASSVFVYRFFCRIFCPLGAIYSLFNRVAFFRMHCDKDACISCGRCADACLLHIEPQKTPNAAECVRCSSCVGTCPTKALSYKRK